MVTYGEIRRLLRQSNAQWFADLGPPDDKEVATPPLGPYPMERGPAPGIEEVDPAWLAERYPTGNPYLRARRAVLGLPTGREPIEPAYAERATPRNGVSELGLESVVDWRNRWGYNWVTQVRDQGPCNSALAFAYAALFESMVRIEQCVWCVRSEGDPHDGQGLKCSDYGDWYPYGRWIIKHGICDPACWPYTTDNPVYDPTPDRDGRTVKTNVYNLNGLDVFQKQWLDAHGPAMVPSFPVYEDFYAYRGGVYTHTGGGRPLGTQALAIVGYNDNEGCWIVKNSWGTGWGESGYIRIGYGVLNIESPFWICLVSPDPDPWTLRRTHNGNLLRSGGSKLHLDFQLVAPTSGGQIQQWTCDNDGTPFKYWKLAATFGAQDAAYPPTFTGTTYGRNLECVYPTNQGRLHHWWLDAATGKWMDGNLFGPADAAGVPGFIQSNYGAPGDFEVVVRLGTTAQLQHWRRDNQQSRRWLPGPTFGSGVKFSGPSLIQSNYGRRGDFELVCVLDTGQMEHWRRANDDGAVWQSVARFGKDIYGSPVMIENQSVTATEVGIGDFHLCVATRAGSVQHWRRNNQGEPYWYQNATFGQGIESVLGLSESFSDFELEAIVLRTDGYFQRYGYNAGTWYAAERFGPAK